MHQLEPQMLCVEFDRTLHVFYLIPDTQISNMVLPPLLNQQSVTVDELRRARPEEVNIDGHAPATTIKRNCEQRRSTQGHPQPENRNVRLVVRRCPHYDYLSHNARPR